MIDIIILFLSLFRYFTVWILLIDLLYYLGLIKNIEVSLIFLHTIVLVYSIIFVYISPKKINIELYNSKQEFNILLEGKKLIIIDIIFHWIPFIILLYIINKNNGKLGNNNILNVILPLIYIIFFDIEEIYKLNKKLVVVIYLILYFLVYSLKI